LSWNENKKDSLVETIKEAYPRKSMLIVELKRVKLNMLSKGP
jgi:hypothetical protein